MSKVILQEFVAHFGSENVLIAENGSSAMITADGKGEPIYTFIQFTKNSQNQPVITFEYTLLSGENLPFQELFYTLHTINYTAFRQQGTPDLVLGLRPGMQGEDGSADLPPAIVAMRTIGLNQAKKEALPMMFKVELKKVIDMQSSVQNLVEAFIVKN